MKPRALVIDDEVQIRRLLRVALEGAGYDVQEAEGAPEGGFEAVAVVHNETSTGLQNPVKEIAEAVRAVAPDTRFVQIDPAINVIGSAANPGSLAGAAAYNESQFHGFDMMRGRYEPELGGDERYLDMIGLNYYFHNQWRYPNRRKIPPGHKDYKPLRDILADYYARYNRPLFIAETGIEDDERPDWLSYVGDEVKAAVTNGVPVEGICIYPIVNHPGWVDDRHCHNGLWDYIDENHEREIYTPLADEIKRQIDAFDKFFECSNSFAQTAR